MRKVWDYLKRVPAAVYAALGTALAIALLVLRGRRLEAELAKSKVREQAEKAKAVTAKHEGRREVHVERAEVARKEAEELQAEVERIEAEGSEDKARIDRLEGTELHEEYLALARRAKERARQR
jgi:predicted RNase H-like nuclease (RuvC/YqgF family)